MIKEYGEYGKRIYDIYLASALASCGFKGDIATAAAIIYQIDYWIDKAKDNAAENPEIKKKHFKKDKWWIYNTVKDWRLQFPYLAEKTIARTLSKLAALEIIQTDCFNQFGYDRTKWYTLDYERLESLMQKEKDKLSYWNDTQIDKSNRTSCPHGIGQSVGTYTKEYSKNKTYNSHGAERAKNRSWRNDGSSLINEYSKCDFAELEKQFVENL